MSEVTWSMFNLDANETPIARDHSTIVASFAVLAPNATSTAQEICERFFNDAMWTKHYGTEDTCAIVRLEIHTPSAIAGTYRVSLERRTKATAERLLPVMRETTEAVG